MSYWSAVFQWSRYIGHGHWKVTPIGSISENFFSMDSPYCNRFLTVKSSNMKEPYLFPSFASFYFSCVKYIFDIKNNKEKKNQLRLERRIMHKNNA